MTNVEGVTPVNTKTIRINPWGSKEGNDCLESIIKNEFGLEYGADDYFRIEKELMDANKQIYGTETQGVRRSVGGKGRRNAVLYDGEEFIIPEIKEPSTSDSSKENKPPQKPAKLTKEADEHYNKLYNKLSQKYGISVSTDEKGKITWEVEDTDNKTKDIYTFDDYGNYVCRWSPVDNPDIKYVKHYNNTGKCEKYELESPLAPDGLFEHQDEKNDKGENSLKHYLNDFDTLTKKSNDKKVNVSKNKNGQIIWEYRIGNTKYKRTYNKDGSYQEMQWNSNTPNNRSSKSYDKFGNEKK